VIRGVFGPGTIVLGGGALLLGGFLAVGFFLPTSWKAGAEVVVAAAPEEVMHLLDAPEAWQTWTQWPDSTERSGPERGAGSMISWIDRELGSGAFRIEAGDPLSVTYSVTVAGAGGADMETRGSVQLSAASGGTRVAWLEEGDLGRNPLMGYWALSMERAQSAEMQKGLDRLSRQVREAVEAGSPSGGAATQGRDTRPVRPDSVRTR
jgi:hypothetical protein